MRNFTQKLKADKQSTFAKSLKPGQAHLGRNPEVSSLYHLQRTIGNQAVQRLIESKLEVNTPGDVYEREADLMATQVMRIPESSMSHGKPHLVQAHKSLQRKHRVTSAGPEKVTSQSAIDAITRSPGRPLDSTTRIFMESRFDHDFSHVRVYNDAQAFNAARSVNARAFTVGPDVVFGAGQYAPQTNDGRTLLAHELSHVIQQRAAKPLMGREQSSEKSTAAQLTHISGHLLQRRVRREGEMMPMSASEFREALIAATQALVTTNAPTLGPALRRTLEGSTAIPSQVALIADAQRNSVGLRYNEQFESIEATADLLVRNFIFNPNISSLDLLPAAQRNRVRNFNWGRNDYPGGASGRNEGRARQMSRQLSAIRPERRANLGADAVITRAQHTTAVQQHIRDNLVAIPAFPAPAEGGTTFNQPAGQRLYRNAQEAFMNMRAAALADDVPLIVRSSYRDPAAAAARAAAAGNPSAVASFSSHGLGLAVDLQMSLTYTDMSGQQQNSQFTETTTTPMQNVIDMRESPVHKWLFLHGAEYGWFPYQNEPWHWEYNPVGFRAQFIGNINPPQQP